MGRVRNRGTMTSNLDTYKKRLLGTKGCTVAIRNNLYGCIIMKYKLQSLSC